MNDSELSVKYPERGVNYFLAALIFSVFTSLNAFAGTPGQVKKKPARLFIIGGGDRTELLMRELLSFSGLQPAGYVVVLPMASEEPDSAVVYLQEDFKLVGITRVVGMNFREGETISPERIDSLKAARLIFISGGDQTRFMKAVGRGAVYQAIHDACRNGTVIAGTSAGAAVMSKKMITGNSLKYPEYTGRYPSIEANDIEISEGLGLTEKLIVDQHFLKRQRMNRLLAVSIENPGEICVGIDESTAVALEGNRFTVAGENQVVVIQNQGKSKQVKKGLLGGRNLRVDILLPGETLKIPR